MACILVFGVGDRQAGLRKIKAPHRSAVTMATAPVPLFNYNREGVRRSRDLQRANLLKQENGSLCVCCFLFVAMK